MSDDWKIRFGTAGTSDSFAAQGYKTSLEVPEYTAKMGLNAFEYQCGRGGRLGLDKAAKMAALAAPKDILFSVHAPYYIRKFYGSRSSVNRKIFRWITYFFAQYVKFYIKFGTVRSKYGSLWI